MSESKTQENRSQPADDHTEVLPQDAPATDRKDKCASAPPCKAVSLDEYLDNFEDAWRDGKQPRLEDFLPPPGDGLRLEVLIELIHADLEHRYQAGEPVRVEAYFERFPELNQARAALTLIQSEYMLRRKRETELPPDEYALRFPQFRAELASRLLCRFDWPSKTPALEPSREEIKSGKYPEVPGYEILGLLGRGGMGIVYKARHNTLKRIVALKLILGGSHAPKEQLERFFVEARAVARLQHPNIVQIYEIGDKDLPYFALEYVDGGSLDRKMAGKPQPPRQAAELLETLARAIHVAHQHNIVHRDLKPANILLQGGGVVSGGVMSGVMSGESSKENPTHHSPLTTHQPKITDFGLAKQLDDATVQTRTGIIMGTPSYMAPEQTRTDFKQIGPAADVYALGAILYDMLTGRPPFKAANEIDMIEQLRSAEPLPPSRLSPAVPRDLETICLKCLRKEPQQRYASALDLADDLHRFLGGEPIHARPVTWSERAWKWARRRPMAAALVAFVALTAVMTGGLLVSARQEHERVAGRGDEAQELIVEAQTAASQRDWQVSRTKAASALAAAQGETSLAALSAEAARLLRQAEAHLKAEDKHQQFLKAREEALFHQTLMSGRELLINTSKARSSAQEALALYGIAPESGTGPTLDEAYTQQEKAAIATDCYQLLLIVALAETQSPGQKEKRRHAEYALACLDLAAKLGPDTRAYHLRRARCLELLDRPDEARKEKSQVARIEPSTVLDHFLLGEEYYKHGKLDLAIQSFDSALRLRSDDFWSHYYRALCHLRQQNLAQARAGLDYCLYRRKDFVWAYLVRAYLHGASGDFKAAEADYAQALAMKPDDDVRYCVFVNRGEMSIRRDRIAEAIADLQQAIDLIPQQYHAYVNLARAYKAGKQYERAAEQLEKALRLEPGAAAIYRERAYLELDQLNLATALTDFERAIQLDPSPRDHFERGRIFYRQRRFDQALEASDEALALRGDYSEAHRLRAECLLELKRYHEAVHSFDRALENGPPSADVLWERGRAKALLGNHVDAINDYTQALQHRPNDAQVLSERGWAHLASDAPKAALVDFEEVIRLKPEDADAHNGRGYARVKLGQHQKAVADAREAQKRGPESPRMLYNSARIYSQAAGKLDADPAARSKQALEQRYEYQSQAILLIRKALDLLPVNQRGAFWQQNIHGDPAMVPIRRSTGFIQLEKQMSGS